MAGMRLRRRDIISDVLMMSAIDPYEVSVIASEKALLVAREKWV